MESDIVELKEETKEKLRDFDEQEAYFLLCEIFSQAQATKDFAKFQIDLAEWKKRFPIELFSESYKIKIKYMLSKEFLDTVLKGFIVFDELSKKDPSKGLEKLRKILDKAEKHKDAKQLDKDLDELYKEYPLKFLKEKYPHLINQLLSKSNRTRILEKFDSNLAYKELNTIIEHPENFESADEFRDTIKEWQVLYPIADFNDKFKGQVDKLLLETLDTRRLEELFPMSNELNLNIGESIPLELRDTVKNISLISKDALHEFFKIVDKNKGDIDSLFNWVCKYNRYINSFDDTIKSAIVDNLMSKYAYELPPVNTKYQIPKMEAGANDLLSLSEYNSINDTKKQVVLQLLGILSTGNELTHEDNYRLEIIGLNAQKVTNIEKSKIEPKLNLFMEKFPEDKLTLTDTIYLESISDTRAHIAVEDDIDLTIKAHENDAIEVEEALLHEDELTSFKTTIKYDEPLEKVDTSSTTSGTSDNGGSTGGTSVSIPTPEIQDTIDDKDNDEELADDIDDEEPDITNIKPSLQNFFKRFLYFATHDDETEHNEIEQPDNEERSDR